MRDRSKARVQVHHNVAGNRRQLVGFVADVVEVADQTGGCTNGPGRQHLVIRPELDAMLRNTRQPVTGQHLDVTEGVLIRVRGRGNDERGTERRLYEAIVRIGGEPGPPDVDAGLESLPLRVSNVLEESLADGGRDSVDVVMQQGAECTHVPADLAVATRNIAHLSA